MEMIMMAKQARAATKDVVSSRVEDSLTIVKDAILSSIKEGEYYAIVYCDMPHSVLTMLETAGYTVTKYVNTTTDPVSTGWRISWEN